MHSLLPWNGGKSYITGNHSYPHKFTNDLLKSSSKDSFKKVVTPLPLNLKLSATEGQVIEDPSVYRSIIGKLNFLTNTRPDLSYTVKTLSQFMQKPRSSHWEALMHVLNYVHTTCGQGIILKGDDKLVLQA